MTKKFSGNSRYQVKGLLAMHSTKSDKGCPCEVAPFRVGYCVYVTLGRYLLLAGVKKCRSVTRETGRKAD